MWKRSAAVSSSFSSRELLLATLIVGHGDGKKPHLLPGQLQGSAGVQIRNQSSVKGSDGSDKANGNGESGRGQLKRLFLVLS